MTSGPALIPAPTSLTLLEGRLTLPPRLPTSGPLPWVDTLRTLLTPGSGLAVDQTLDESTALVRLVERASVVGPPGSYDLTVDGSGVTLESPDRAGLVHAVATLRQLLPAWACGPAPAGIGSISLPHLRIHDEPYFAWRGMHLDVGRHFQPLDSLLRFVDLLALHKFNVFHLHLTEDQGWRFEVTAYPRLTEVGAARPETRLPAWATGDGTPHGGYYTQAQLRALVAYAAERGITVVPEIDLPGHVRALLAAYPEFGEPTAPATTVATTVGVFPEVLHLADATVAMIETVLAELLDVFPSPDIHIGGDECPREQWRGSAAAGVLAAERGLSDVDLLQQWFTTHLRDWLASRGRRLVGWDEIIDDGPLTDTLVMSWQGSEPGARAMAQGNDVVLCAPPYYFDHYQSTDPEEPYAIGGLATWQDVLTTDPYAGVAAPLRPHLLGVQGQVWTEYLPTPRHVDYATWPRA
ncbi:MAG: beta-N-acetylhexosaminidase, partial [Lapillicoccus sp.]